MHKSYTLTLNVDGLLLCKFYTLSYTHISNILVNCGNNNIMVDKRLVFTRFELMWFSL